MAPYYGLTNTNKKPIVSNLLKCQQNFFNPNSDGKGNLGKETIISCKLSAYANNQGLFLINPSSIGNSESECCNNINNYEGKLFTSQSTTANISKQMRYANYINALNGRGKPVYVLNYNQLSFNYLGRIEGQYGGGGVPLRNRF